MSKRKERQLAREESIRDAMRLPEEGEALPVVVMRSQRSGHHPWIYKRMLGERPERAGRGALVEVRAKDGEFIGRGFYNDFSEIGCRLLSEAEEIYPGREFFLEAIAAAVALRRQDLRLEEVTNAYRVVHSEGDGLSGLIVDRFGDLLVVEIHSAGIYRHFAWVHEGLMRAFPGARVIVNADRRTQRLEGVRMDDVLTKSERDIPHDLKIHEHGVRYGVDLRRGHKTGFFLDQRENRRRVGALCKDQDVFDGFCYTGGFAFAAIRGGARRVEAVDLDEAVIEQAEINAKQNDLHRDPRLIFRHGNVFEALREYRAAERRFTRIILDPPKLASKREDRGKALTAYADMNRLAMTCLEPGGLLFTCSCTGMISEEEFVGILRATAGRIGRDLQILAIEGAAADHPWSIHMPEGRYLKAVTARVRMRVKSRSAESET